MASPIQASTAAVAAVMLALLACSSGDTTGYPGVVRWKCYLDTSQSPDDVCDCHGLGQNEDIIVVGTGVREVPACTGLDECRSYRDLEGDWACTCRSSAFDPPGATSVAQVSACPPW